jgi:Bacterial Ig-like domain (group 1)
MVITMCKSGIFTAVAALLLTACGGSQTGSSVASQPSTGGTGSGGGAVNASAVTLTASTATIPSDGSTNATITAFVRDASNNLIAGIPVSFTASSGGISGSPSVTDASGTATASLITAGDSSLRTITVTALAGSLQATVTVQVVASNTTSTVQMGNGTAGAFQSGIIGISSPSLSAGGSTSVAVSLVQTGGTLYTGSATVSFNSPCIAAGRAEIRVNGTAASSVTTTTGLATVTYVAKGCSGPDLITATSTVGTQSLSATGTVTVAAATVGSISYVSATPTNIALKGTGSATRPELSTVVYKVLDNANGPVQGLTVNFTLDTTLGGITLTAASAVSDSQGLVQTQVSSGTVATSVKVTRTDGRHHAHHQYAVQPVDDYHGHSDSSELLTGGRVLQHRRLGPGRYYYSCDRAPG